MDLLFLALPLLPSLVVGSYVCKDEVLLSKILVSLCISVLGFFTTTALIPVVAGSFVPLLLSRFSSSSHYHTQSLLLSPHCEGHFHPVLKPLRLSCIMSLYLQVTPYFFSLLSRVHSQTRYMWQRSGQSRDGKGFNTCTRGSWSGRCCRFYVLHTYSFLECWQTF